jgi:hypothetical protein
VECGVILDKKEMLYHLAGEHPRKTLEGFAILEKKKGLRPEEKEAVEFLKKFVEAIEKSENEKRKR